MRSLLELAGPGPFDTHDAVGWALRLARRVQRLHARGLVHGSISPAAVRAMGTSPTERAVLADAPRVVTEMAYASPERASWGRPSEAADVWAIGASLQRLLTGSPPFPGVTEEELRASIRRCWALPLAVFDVGDDRLQLLLDQVFAPRIETRLTTAAALRAALEAWLGDSPHRSLPALEADRLDDDDDDDRTAVFSTALATAVYPPQTSVTVVRRVVPGPACVQRHGLRWGN